MLLSSCSFHESKTAARSEFITETCVIAVVDPETGSIRQLIEANDDNWYKNRHICARKFEQIRKHSK